MNLPGQSDRPRRPADSARLLPDVSADETDEGWGELPDRTDDDRLLGELPPHHIG